MSTDPVAASGGLSPDDAVEQAKRIVAAFCTDVHSSDPAACEERKATCLSGTPRAPYLARYRSFTCSDPGCTGFEDRGTYYLVPFDLPDGTTPCIVTLANQQAGMAPGAHMETRWGAPIRYLPITESAAVDALQQHLVASGLTSPVTAPAAALVDYPMTVLCGWSFEFPLWTFVLDGREWYVDQQGVVHDAITAPTRGGGGPPAR